MPPIMQESQVGRTKLSNMILITIGANAVKRRRSLARQSWHHYYHHHHEWKITNQDSQQSPIFFFANPTSQHYPNYNITTSSMQCCILQRIAPLITYFSQITNMNRVPDWFTFSVAEWYYQLVSHSQVVVVHFGEHICGQPQNQLVE